MLTAILAPVLFAGFENHRDGPASPRGARIRGRRLNRLIVVSARDDEEREPACQGDGLG
jgi:hypothetical protein